MLLLTMFRKSVFVSLFLVSNLIILGVATGTDTGTECPEDKPYSHSDKCHKCPQDKPYSHSDKCHKCPDSTKEVEGICCPIGKPYVYDKDGNGSKECNLCPANKPKFIKYLATPPPGKVNNICCTEDKPYYYNGECKKCKAVYTEIDGICCENNDQPYVYDKDGDGTKECNFCPANTTFVSQTATPPGQANNICCPKSTYYHNGSCISCGPDKDCPTMECPSGKKANGVCCSMARSYVYDKDGDGTKECNFCPEDNPILSSSWSWNSWAKKINSAKCCPKDKRHYYDGKCNKCRAGYTEIDGICCNDSMPYVYDKDGKGSKECHRCPEDNPIESGSFELNRWKRGNAKCCPKDKRHYHSSLDQCYRCPPHQPYASPYASGSSLIVCNRACKEGFVANKTNFECCPKDTPHWFQGKCIATCPEDTPHWYNDTCNQCLENEEFDAETKKCVSTATETEEEEEDEEEEEEEEEEDDGGEGAGGVQ